ncbi:hypothetical protein LWI29_011938 [Acer saccharum]|uniref:YqgF/RNase H-like domain-containing protein n=1 Tax=Acer saccharum TaxID=4024 RepID=A0AA39RDC0_ACESA|nr:hypothetical protein LWI29_011938 [Acer saccharum]
MVYMKQSHLFKIVKGYNENVESSERLCLLGVDTGEAYTGLAVTNLVLTESWPFKVINMSWCRRPGQLANYLERVITKWKIGGLLVGYSAMNNHRLEDEHMARVFKWLKAAHESAHMVDFPFTFVDERNSSIEAEKILNGWILNGWDPAPVDYTRVLNKVAASVFTEISYLPLSVIITTFKKENVKRPFEGFGVLIPSKE